MLFIIKTQKQVFKENEKVIIVFIFFKCFSPKLTTQFQQVQQVGAFLFFIIFFIVLLLLLLLNRVLLFVHLFLPAITLILKLFYSQKTTLKSPPGFFLMPSNQFSIQIETWHEYMY